jgi:site-specific recombinase XerC
VAKGLPHVLILEQVERLIAAAERLRDRALVETMYATGCYVSFRSFRTGGNALKSMRVCAVGV